MVKRKSSPARLVWERLQDVKPAKRQTYRKIVAVAMRIADREGLAGVSMRGVAERLGTGPMSLYRYVQSKDELFDLLLDSAYGEIHIPAKNCGDWRKDLVRVAWETRTVLKQHPWLGALVNMRPALGPNYLRWFEFLLAGTRAASRDPLTQTRIVGTVWAYVAGFTGYELGELETNRRHLLTKAHKSDLTAPYLQRILATGQFPNLMRFVESGARVPDDAGFEFGLRAVLAGLSSNGDM